MIVGADLEWSPRRGIDVLGLSWDSGQRATATGRTPETLIQYMDILRNADKVVGQNFLDADCRQLALEGVDTGWLESKIYDIRLSMHVVNGHLAGTGSFDLRSIVLLLGGRQGYRFPLEFKQYESDLHKTCAMDAAAALWCYPTLERQIEHHNLRKTLEIAHRCQPVFSRMREQGVRLDRGVLETIHKDRKRKTEEVVERYHLWEERGKKVIKKVPIWRSDKILDICEQQFGFRPKDRQRGTWAKLALDPALSPEALEFVNAVIDLGKGANDAHWLGKAEESDDGTIDFDKVGADGFIHPRYDLCGSPDRAIASGPNIQNFPRPSDDPRPVKLRSAVIPLTNDHVILGCDLGSVETYTNAIESDDWDRVRAIQEGRLSHTGTAVLINNAFGLALDRNAGKACNHAFDKGESPYNLGRRLFKTERPSRQQTQQCQAIFARMLDEYPKTAAFRKKLWEQAQNNPLVVTNSFGRRLLCFSRSKYGDANERFAKHQPAKLYWCPCSECAPRRDRWKYAIAFLGRSSAFDALLRIMAKIYYEKRLDEYSLPYMEVHDELCWSVPKDRAEHYARVALEAFSEPFEELGGLCLPADAKVGWSWCEAH